MRRSPDKPIFSPFIKAPARSILQTLTLTRSGGSQQAAPAINVSVWRMLRAGALINGLKMGLSGLRRIDNSENYTRNMHHRCITEPHWYLWVLGVDPSRQGQGIGGA